MEELIQITTGEQGLPVVKSARELHAFLEVKSRFNDWFKNRVAKYDFVEGKDYVLAEEGGFTKNLVKEGRPELDYALSLDMAKELAMVERTEKGKAARQYFIEKEKQLRAVLSAPAPATTEQVLIQLVSQTNQLMAAQQQLLAGLRADVDELRNAQPAAPASLPPHHRRPSSGQLGLPGIPPPRPASSSLRQQIYQHVLTYSGYHGAAVGDTYSYLYRRLFEVYSISVNRLNRQPAESILDVLERYGHMDRLYSLVQAELIFPHE